MTPSFLACETAYSLNQNTLEKTKFGIADN